MKRNLVLPVVLLATLGVVGCANTQNPTSSAAAPTTSSAATPTTSSAAAQKIDVKVWCAENIQALTTTQLNEGFKAKYPTLNVNFTVEPVGEGDASSKVTTDVEAAADVFCFAQDQLASIYNAGGLAEITGTVKESVIAANDAGSVKAGTLDDKLVAYPLTSDNGYFMYYDKRYIQEASLDDMSKLIADCKTNSKLFSFEVTGSAWYNAAFFFATGCESTWTTNSEGAFTAVTDTYNSDAGLVAMKGMQELIKSGVYNSSSAAPAAFGSGSAICISGTWDYEKVLETLGENMGIADLPSFTVDGKSYHLGSFSGNKLMGVKPQQDATKAAVCQLVAEYLTSEQCQAERFAQAAWGPSNKNVQASDAVKQNPALVALAQQNEFAIPQGQYPNAWWNVAKALVESIQTYDGTCDDTTLKGFLEAYQGEVNKMIAA